MEWSNRRKRLSSVQIIILFYAFSVVTASLLLKIPLFHNPGIELSLIDAFFTAISAISVTGLTVVNTAETFNVWGRLVLIVIFQIGGIGIMALGTFLWILLGRSIGLEQRRWIAIDHNRSTLSGLVALMLTILKLALIIEAIGTVILGLYFYYSNVISTWHAAMFYGFFSSVSAFTNAGFDIFGNSLMRFHDDHFVQTVHMLLIILGAIGFPVLIEIQENWKNYWTNKRIQFSLFTKITSLTYFGLLGLGAVVFYLLERNHFLADKSPIDSFFYSLFNSVTSRSGGLATMDFNALTDPTLFFISLLMFIGASPSSVGGGIRTTTFVVILLTIVIYMRGRTEIKIFRRELHPEDINKAIIVFIFATNIVIASVFFIMVVEGFSMVQIIFEVTSAFGTCGSSLGITPYLSSPSKILLMILMFIGRVGIIPFLLLLKRDEKKTGFHYLKERIIVG
ncbi:TrkH family potassium uptake protein [Ammoniphilus sp. CFH 90114]|uniref:TrkH family potassium uptake protein n=1 Tax=Ammoniphilus sp. CFH 90114 TaxID=2493665 RepID=UPI00100E8F8D|nr:TrkH family potassium uptake protein [Ammoniphilus sp. CFH 90114]RXT05255.1 TrkH family potassium uptake protein [Ammoniphilus sp. CFH 90114]